MKKIIFILATLGFSLSQAEIFNLKAEYSVPVPSAADFDLNKFLISDYQIEVRSTADATLTFTLPEDMVGRSDQKMVFLSTAILEDSTKILKGPSGTAVCKGPWTQAQCTFVFRKVKIDEAHLKDVLKLKLNPQDANRQLHLIQRFGNDPIGVSKILN